MPEERVMHGEEDRGSLDKPRARSPRTPQRMTLARYSLNVDLSSLSPPSDDQSSPLSSPRHLALDEGEGEHPDDVGIEALLRRPRSQR